MATFNIGVTIVEPGGARSDFRYGSAIPGAQDGRLQQHSSRMVHTVIKDTSRPPQGDPARMLRIMIDRVDLSPAPKRIALGSDARGAIHKALTDRLAVLEAQKDLAFSSDLFKKRVRVGKKRQWASN